MSDAIVAAFNDAATWDQALSAIRDNAAALLDGTRSERLAFLQDDADREQAVGLAVNEIKSLFGNFRSFAEVQAVVERQIDVEYAKYEFVYAFQASETVEDIRTVLERVQLLLDDRESTIQEWSSSSDPAVKARADELAAEVYTILLKKIAAHLGNGPYLDALAAEMMTARQEHGPFNTLNSLIHALSEAADVLGPDSIVTSFNEAADWEAMLALVKSHAAALLDADHLAKLNQLSDENPYEQAVGLGVIEVRTLFGHFAAAEQITAAIDRQIDMAHGRFAALSVINGSQDAGSMATALSIHVSHLHQQRQELIADWRASGDTDATARADEMEDEGYTIILKEVSSHLGDEMYVAELAARMHSARQNGLFHDSDAMIAALAMADNAINAVHDAVISGTNSGVMSEDDARGIGGLLTVRDGDWGESRFKTVLKGELQKQYGAFSFSSNTGEWSFTLNSAAQTLREGQQVHQTLTVQSLDGTAAATITVTINAANDRPHDVTLSDTHVDENATTGTIVGTLTGSDIDSDALAFTLIDDAGGRFAISNGKLVVKDGVRLDHEQALSHTLVVQVKDGSNATYQETFVIHVNDEPSESITGSFSSDLLKGGSGSDTLWGSLGNDQLTGGSGKDIFVFDTKGHKSTNRDRIVDFSVKDDAIWFDNKVFIKLGKSGSEKKPVQLNKDFFTIGMKAKDKNDYLIYDKAKGVLLYDADGSGKGKSMEIASLSKKLAITFKDFFVV